MTRTHIAALAALSLVSGCRPRSAPATAASKLVVRVSGCRAVRITSSGGTAGQPRTAVCEVDRGSTLRAWLAAPPEASITARLDGVPIAIRSMVPAQGGVRASIDLPDRDATSLEVEAEIGARAAAPAVRALGHVALAIPPPLPSVEAARALRRGGHLDEGLAAVRRLAADPSEPVRLQALRLQARIERDLGRLAEASEHLQQAISAAHLAGRVSDELDDRVTLVHLLTFETRDLRLAARVLQEIDGAELESLYPDGAARLPYYAGLLAYESGDMAAAGRRFHLSGERSIALGLATQEVDARGMEADALVFLGRSREAARLLDDALAAIDGSTYECQRAHLLTNRGYSLVRMAPDDRQAALGRAVDVMAPLLEAVKLYEKPACRSPADLANALTNVALGELDHDHWNAAERYLEKAKQAAATRDARLGAAWMEIEGRIALADPARRAQAEQLFEVALQTGIDEMPEAQLTAAAGLATALEQARPRRGGAQRHKGPGDAQAAWEAVDRVLEETSRRLPIGEGRDSYLDRAERIAGLRIDFLLRTRPAAEAAAAARRSRSRLMRSLAWLDELGSLPAERRSQRDVVFAELALARKERSDASLESTLDGHPDQPVARRGAAGRRLQEAETRYRAAVERALATVTPARDVDVLQAPEQGDLLLVYHRVRDGWAGFAVEPRATTARRIGRIDSNEPPGELAGRLLGPFAAAIGRARRLRFAASGLVSEIDLHALPWKGRLLVEHLSVAWTLDLPRAVTPGDATHTALLVGAPAHDWAAEPAAAPLPQTAEELGSVGRALSERGWSTRTLANRDATRAALRGAIESGPLRLLHYAGHAFASSDPWDSGLPLAGADWLTVADVTALGRVPDRVVLSACQSASGHERSLASGLGLAQAFLLRGASQVVATTRPVPDAYAAELMARMFAAGGRARIGGPPGQREGDADLVEALARAQREMAAVEPHGPWSAFRVLVP